MDVHLEARVLESPQRHGSVHGRAPAVDRAEDVGVGVLVRDRVRVRARVRVRVRVWVRLAG